MLDRLKTRIQRLIPWTLRGQIGLALALITLLTILTLGVYLDRSMRETNLAEIEIRLEAEARLIGRTLANDLNAGADVSVIQPQVQGLGSDTETRITIIASDGTVVGDSAADPATMNNHLDRPEIAEAFLDGEGIAQRQSGTFDQSYLYVAVRIPDAPSYVSEVAMPMTRIDAANAELRRRIALAGIMAALAATIAGLYFARSERAPDGVGRSQRRSRAPPYP